MSETKSSSFSTRVGCPSTGRTVPIRRRLKQLDSNHKATAQAHELYMLFSVSAGWS